MSSKYQLGPRIGVGGMADVFQAFDTMLHRPVAIKIMKETMADNKRFVERFGREARVNARLRHPNIVQVYELGEIEGRPMLVMELLEGETLKERLQRGPMSEAEAVNVTRQVLLALAFAQDQEKVVHRDIKPGNVFLCRGWDAPEASDGLVKLMDFGIASAAAEIQVTVGGERLVVMNMHVTAPVPDLPPTVSPHLKTVVLTALAKDPMARYPNARTMSAALLGRNSGSWPEIPAQTGGTNPRIPAPDTGQRSRTHPPSAPRMPTYSLIGGGIIALGACGALGAMLLDSPKPPPVQPITAVPTPSATVPVTTPTTTPPPTPQPTSQPQTRPSPSAEPNSGSDRRSSGTDGGPGQAEPRKTKELSVEGIRVNFLAQTHSE